MAEENRILVLIDWDNIFINLMDALKPEQIQLSLRFDKLEKWLETIGKIWDVFVFAPPGLTPFHRKIIREHGFYFIACDKIEKGREQIDTVDESLIRFGKSMLNHSDINYLCLASGDDDFIDLLKLAQKRKLKIAIATANFKSLSANLLPFADKHPKTQKKMILRLDE